MQIPDLIRKCVVFIGYETSGGARQLAGTGFFVSRHILGGSYHFSYIVTAKHVIDAIRDNLCDKVLLRINFKDGNAYWVETPIDLWISHPDDTEVDVAIAGFPMEDEFDCASLPTFTFLTDEIISQERIGAGEDIAITGLFVNHYGHQRNIPIIRGGIISAMPEEKVQTQSGLIDAYLIEARSIGGLSGSPVFAYLGISRMLDGEVRHQHSHPAMYLLGLMHGHYDIGTLPSSGALRRENVNMGIGIVVPATKILEVINQPMVRKGEKKVEEQLKKQQLPTPDTALE